jgi:hypothetical protein
MKFCACPKPEYPKRMYLLADVIMQFCQRCHGYIPRHLEGE